MPINLPKIGEDKKKKVSSDVIALQEKNLSAKKESALTRMRNVQKARRS